VAAYLPGLAARDELHPEALMAAVMAVEGSGAGAGVIANHADVFAPIATEQAVLNPSREQRRALYACWPMEGRRDNDSRRAVGMT
jgi:hypothetical protein